MFTRICTVTYSCGDFVGQGKEGNGSFPDCLLENVYPNITDDHPSDVNAFTWLQEIFDGGNRTFIKQPAYSYLAIKRYLFFDVIHLFKNSRNNLLNQKKFVFSLFQFDLSCAAIHMQSVLLTLAIFQESTPAAIKCCFPNRLDAANFFTLFYEDFFICNSRQCVNTPNQFGNAAIQGDHKQELSSLWQTVLKHGQNVHHLPLSNKPLMLLWQLLDVLLIWLMTCCMKTDDYILTSKFQSDPIERHFSKYRQMSSRRLLVSFKEVNNPEKILSLNSIIKADLNFWEEKIYVENKIDSVTLEKIS